MVLGRSFESLAVKMVVVLVTMCLSGYAFAVDLAADITIHADGKTTTAGTEQINLTTDKTGIAVFGSEDFQSLSQSGEPQIPWKMMTVLLPPNADMATVSCGILSATYETIEGVCGIAPTPPILTRDADGNEIEIWPTGKMIVDGCDTGIYSADALWPSETVQLTGTGRLRSWRLAEIAVPLVRYNPVSGELQQLVQADISVDYSKKGKADAHRKHKPFSRNPATGKRRGYDRVKKLAMNFDAAAVVYEAAEGSTATVQEDAPAGDGDVILLSPPETNDGYVIITTNAIRTSLGTTLDDFVTHKQGMGFTVTVIDEDDLWGVETPVEGDASATKLRGWLQANYQSMDTKYALIIGDPQLDNSYVPMKLYPCGDRNIPTDYFYAELTCDWDKDGDGIIGEKGDDATSGDEIERYFEVYVGRIPYYNNINDTKAILQKTMDYENSQDTDWRHNTLISVKPSNFNTPHYDWGEAVKANLLEPKAISSDRVYLDGYGQSPSMHDINPPAEYPPTTYPADVWSQDQYGLHVWSSHGGEKYASGIINSGDTPNLDNNHPSAVWQTSCKNAKITNIDNLSYSLLKNGAIVSIGATETSYFLGGEHTYSDSASNCGMGYRYAKGISEGKSCGAALWDLKEETSGWWTHNWTLFNPYGDPSVVVLSETPDFTITPTDRFYTKQHDEATVILTDRTYTLKNNTDSSLNWTANKTESWFDLSASSGSIPAGGLADVEVALNSGVKSLALGTHTDTITFTDTTNGITVLRDVEYVIERKRVPQSGWTLQYVDSEEPPNHLAANAFDGDGDTIWHTEWIASDPPHPHEIQIDLGNTYNVRGFAYLPRQNMANGRIANYEFYVSEGGVDWGSAVATGTFANTADEQEVFFDNVNAHYVRLVALSEVEGRPGTAVAELNVYCQVDPGGILREVWQSISGESVSELTGHADYPDSPDVTEVMYSFEAPEDWADNYGTRMHGFLIPPTTSDYTFWIASDDNSELWLSTDKNPANAAKIANVPSWTDSRQWDKYSQQESLPISLTAGMPYYIMALQKESGAGDNLAVAWSDDGANPQVIDGDYLMPYTRGLTWGPIFDPDPFTAADAWEGYDCDDSIAGWAADPEGGTVAYAKTSGPLWLAVAPDGTLSGIPGDGNVGSNTFTVTATNTQGYFNNANLQITVLNTFTGELGLTDFAALAARWLDTGCTDTPPCGGADLTDDNSVNLDDMASMGCLWLIQKTYGSVVMFWPFDTDASDTAYGHDGTLMNGASINTTDPAVGTGAVELDGDKVTPPAAPSSLLATAVATTQIDLSWTDNASDETGFKIERSIRTNGSFVEIITVGQDVTSYSDTTVRKGTTYYYHVRATNAEGDSAYSNEANATTPKK